MSQAIYTEIRVNNGVVVSSECTPILNTLLCIKLYKTGSFIIYIEKCNDQKDVIDFITGNKPFNRIYMKIIFNDIEISKDIIPIIKNRLFKGRLFRSDIDYITNLIIFDKNITKKKINNKESVVINNKEPVINNLNEKINLLAINQLIKRYNCIEISEPISVIYPHKKSRIE